jgi:N-methylhydantoinase B
MLNAAGFSDSPHLFYSGYDNRPGKGGEWFQLFQIGFGGIPGRPIGDGPDGHSLWPGFTNVPNEFIESYFPLRIEQYKTIPDSGGAGLHRGGNGLSVAYRFLADGEIGIHDERWLTYPWGVLGGDPGMRSTQAHGARRRQRGVAAVEDRGYQGQGRRPAVLQYLGWRRLGRSPFERDPELVAPGCPARPGEREGARRYGVVIADDGSVDDAPPRLSCARAARGARRR